jgi:hypothetical protein
MNRGRESRSESPEERIASGEAWQEFCDTLKSAGHTILAESAPDDPLDRAEGFRYLTRLVRMGLESQLEFNDPRAPVLYRNVHETGKIGADNPDNWYMTAAVSGEYEYRLTGNAGTIHYLGLGTYSAGLSGRATHGYLERHDLEVGSDGSLEIALCCEKRPGNWLPMQPDTRTLLVRQTFLDRENEQIADLNIQRVGGDRLPTPLSAKRLERALRSTAHFATGYAEMFAGWTERMKKRPNELPEFDPAEAAASGGDPNIRYYNGYFDLQPDEALIVEVTPPECEHWNIQLSNYWMESLDYRYSQIHLNKHSAHYEPDGSVRIVIASEDPGIENWLTTAGHRCGVITLRWVSSVENPQPVTRLVKRRELR